MNGDKIMEALFGSKAKILKLFFTRPQLALSAEDIGKRTGLKKRAVGVIISDLVKLGVLKKDKSHKTSRTYRSHQLNFKWPYFNELKNLVLKIAPPSFPKIERGLARLGRVKLAVVTGVFLSLDNTRVDIMVVGDDIDFKRFSDFIKRLEGDLGVELRYVVLGTEEFRYRFDMFDRFVHDILEYPHRKVIIRMRRLAKR